MKKCFFLLCMTGLAAQPARADFTKGSQMVTIFAGIGGSSQQYDLNGPEERPITGSGGAWGAQYLYYASPSIAVGADLNVSYNGNRQDDDLIAGVATTARSKVVTEMAIMRLAFPRGVARPYIFGGLGFHQSSFMLSGKPFTSWSNGGSDSRVLIDEHDASLAVGYGIGIDFFVTESLFFGTELRGTALAGTKPDMTAAAQALGLSLHNREAAGQGNVFFRCGWKFGA